MTSDSKPGGVANFASGRTPGQEGGSKVRNFKRQIQTAFLGDKMCVMLTNVEQVPENGEDGRQQQRLGAEKSEYNKKA
jgi:hypothetical protein